LKWVHALKRLRGEGARILKQFLLLLLDFPSPLDLLFVLIRQGEGGRREPPRWIRAQVKLMQMGHILFIGIRPRRRGAPCVCVGGVSLGAGRRSRIAAKMRRNHPHSPVPAQNPSRRAKMAENGRFSSFSECGCSRAQTNFGCNQFGKKIRKPRPFVALPACLLGFCGGIGVRACLQCIFAAICDLHPAPKPTLPRQPFSRGPETFTVS